MTNKLGLFFSNDADIPSDDVFVARMNKRDKIRKDELIQCLKEELRTPEYIGSNWDALLDVLRDLGWIIQRNVIIYHCGMSELPEPDAKTYLEYLKPVFGIGSQMKSTFCRLASPSESRAALQKLMSSH